MFFDQPVQVEPDVFYTASVVLDGAELSYFGQEGMPEVTAGAVTFQFQCSAESTNGTGVQVRVSLPNHQGFGTISDPLRSLRDSHFFPPKFLNLIYFINKILEPQGSEIFCSEIFINK